MMTDRIARFRVTRTDGVWIAENRRLHSTYRTDDVRKVFHWIGVVLDREDQQAELRRMTELLAVKHRV